jgi:uncharacterized membrane protein YdcZ (DUF606 family)
MLTSILVWAAIVLIVLAGFVLISWLCHEFGFFGFLMADSVWKAMGELISALLGSIHKD